jgi:hypothetical protein
MQTPGGVGRSRITPQASALDLAKGGGFYDSLLFGTCTDLLLVCFYCIELLYDSYFVPASLYKDKKERQKSPTGAREESGRQKGNPKKTRTNGIGKQ